MSSENGGDFWSKAKKPERTRSDYSLDPNAKPPMAKWKKILLYASALAFVMVCVFVMFLPAIASAFAPGIVASQAANYIDGETSVDDVSLSWGGPQRVNGLRIARAGQNLISCDVEVENGLFALITNGANLGRVLVSDAKIKVIRDEKGSVNITTLTKSNDAPQPVESSRQEAVVLPDGLNIKLEVRNLDFTYTDLSIGPASQVSMNDVDLRLDCAADEPILVSIKAKSGEGSVKSELKVTNWSDQGVLHVDRAKIDGSLDVVNLPSSLIDAFVPSGSARPNVRGGLGDALSVKASLQGTRDSGQASVDVVSAGLRLSFAAAMKDEVLSATSPFIVDVTGKSLRALVPSIDSALSASPDISIDSIPDVSFRIADFKMPVSKGSVKTLRGARIDLQLKTTEFGGALTIDDVRRPFRLTPMTVSLQSPDIAESVRGSVNTDLVIDGAPAGTVRMNFNSAGVVDSKGMLSKSFPKDLRAAVSINNIATALLQPFVANSGIDLQQDVGPKLDIALDAVAGVSQTDALPPTTVSASLSSRDITASTKFSIDDRGVEFATDSTRITVASAGRILSRLVKPETGWSVDPRSGTATLTISGAALPQSKSGDFLINQSRARAAISFSAFSAAPIPQKTSPVMMKNCLIRADIDNGKLSIAVNGDSSINDKSATFAANVELPGLLIAPSPDNALGIADFSNLRPSVRASINALPIDAARLFVASDGSQDVMALLRGVVGDSIDITAHLNPDQQSGFHGVGLGMKSPKIAIDLSGRYSKQEVSVANAKLSASLDRSTITSVLNRFAPDISGAPTLSGTSKIDISIGSFTLPFDTSSQPVWSRAGDASLLIQSDGRTLIDGLKIKDEKGLEKDLGRVGFQKLKLAASLPFQTLFGAGQPDARMFSTDLSMTLIGPAQSPLCDVRVNGRVEVEASQPVGPLSLAVAMDRVDVRQLESLAAKQGFVSSFVGDTLSLKTSAVVTPGQDRNPLNFEQSSVVVTNEINAPGVKTNGPLIVSLSPQLFEIQQPAKFEFKLDPVFVNDLLSGGDSKNASIALSKPSVLQLSVDNLVVPRSKNAQFRAKAVLASPEFRCIDAGGRELTLTDLGVRVETESTPTDTPLRFAAALKSVAVDGTKTTSPIAISGGIDQLISSSGVFDVNKAVLTLNADIKGVPTALVDALADQKGMLIDLLGDTTDVFASANKVPLRNVADFDGQQFVFKMSSPRIATSVTGSITDSVFSTSVPLSVSVSEVTNGLTQRFIGAMPVLKKLEKQTVQSPATVSERSLRIPLDSNMKKLNGAVIFDPGEVTYEVNPMLSKLLKENVIRGAGVMGTKLQPATVNFTDGVGVLERYSLPLGEFSVGLEGKLDLVSKNVEMVVWVPASQLADAVTGQVTSLLSAGSAASADSNTILSTLLELVPNWPFKASGPLSSPASSLTLDTDRVFEDFKKNGGYKKLIERIGGSKIKDLLKPKIPGLPK